MYTSYKQASRPPARFDQRSKKDNDKKLQLPSIPQPRVRMSVRELSMNPEKKNAFLRAWKLIKALPADNPNSFWNIGGFHGEPFVPPKLPLEDGEEYWGGWCQHSNVLFPTWHRFYILRLENALRTVCPEDDVTMPYWDETSKKSLEEGIPKPLTDEFVKIDGKKEPNPLVSFTLPEALGNDDGEADLNYAKPAGYTTVRYPYSGIRSPEKAKVLAIQHNREIAKTHPTWEHAVNSLNTNIKAWLKQGKQYPNQPVDDPESIDPNSVYMQYNKCHKATSYNSFSNAASSSKNIEVDLESPHNSMHLAIGGYDMYGKCCGQIKGANGDMGENETAAFDPIFFFHHANVDRMFWVWQKKNGFTDDFNIDPSDKIGTNPSSSEGQGPTTGQVANQQLTMDTPLYPFQAPNGVPVTSRDCINIEKQLGYTYTIGSLDEEEHPTPAPRTVEYTTAEAMTQLYSKLSEADKRIGPSRIFFDVTRVNEKEGAFRFPSHRFHWVNNYLLKINRIDKDRFSGSFLVRAFYRSVDETRFIGQRAILSRFKRSVCKNCQFHRYVDVIFNLKRFILNLPVKVDDFKVEIVSEGQYGGERKITDISPGVTPDTAVEGNHQQPYLTVYSVCTSTLKTI